MAWPNVWIARTPENMRSNYLWTDDPETVKLSARLGWLAFSWDCIFCTGLEFLERIACEGCEPQIGFELFDRDSAKLKLMVDYVAAHFPRATFITQSADGGRTWEVVR